MPRSTQAYNGSHYPHDHALEAFGVPGGLLEVEETETLLMTSNDRTGATLQTLKAAGVHISIDDFGTGYSSLAYLRRFPIDKLKIDRSFICAATKNADDSAIVMAIIRMGQCLNLEVITEGVETANQLAFLRGHDCDQMHGYYFSTPLPVPALEALLLAGTSLPAADGQTLARRALPPFAEAPQDSVLVGFTRRRCDARHQ